MSLPPRVISPCADYAPVVHRPRGYSICRHVVEVEPQVELGETAALLHASTTPPREQLRLQVALPPASKVPPPIPPPPPPPPPPVVGHSYAHPVCNSVDTAAQYYASYFAQQQQQQQQQHEHNAAMMPAIGLPTVPPPAISHAHQYLMMHNPVAAQHYAYACALRHQSAVEAQQQVHAQYQAHRAAAMVRHEEHQAAVMAHHEANQVVAMAQGVQDAHYRAHRPAVDELDVPHFAHTSARQRTVIRFVGELEKSEMALPL